MAIRAGPSSRSAHVFPDNRVLVPVVIVVFTLGQWARGITFVRPRPTEQRSANDVHDICYHSDPEE
jgi:hypothetical protein